MKTIVLIFILALVASGNVFGQRVEDGMAISQLKALFPRYSEMFDEANPLAGFDTSVFYFHGVKGEAEFIFQFGRLKLFQWAYSNGKKPFTPLTKKDRKKLEKVFNGLVADYGPFQTRTTRGAFYWGMPHANVACFYSLRDFRFGVCDSAMAKTMLAPPPHEHDSTSVKR